MAHSKTPITDNNPFRHRFFLLPERCRSSQGGMGRGRMRLSLPRPTYINQTRTVSQPNIILVHVCVFTSRAVVVLPPYCWHHLLAGAGVGVGGAPSVVVVVVVLIVQEVNPGRRGKRLLVVGGGLTKRTGGGRQTGKTRNETNASTTIMIIMMIIGLAPRLWARNFCIGCL